MQMRVREGQRLLAVASLLASLCFGLAAAAFAEDVRGNVVGLFDTATSYSKTRVTLQSVDTALQIKTRVTKSNRFDFEGVPAGEYIVKFKGAKHLKRLVRIQVVAGGTNYFGDLDLVEKEGFHLKEFDQVWRAVDYGLGVLQLEIPYSTWRWQTVPKIVVDKDSFNYGEKGVALLAKIKNFVKNEFKFATGGFMAKPRIKFGKTPEWPEDLSIDDRRALSCTAKDPRKKGRIYVSATIPRGGPTGSAAASVCNGRTIRHAVVKFAKANPPPSTVAHEFLHASGALHPTALGKPEQPCSVMGYPDNRTDPNFWRRCSIKKATDFVSALDMKWGLYVYSRPPGVTSPDDASHLAPIVGQIR